MLIIRFKHWLIGVLGGTPWPEALPGKDVHCHLHFNDQQIKMLADYVMSGVFFNIRTNPGVLLKKRKKKSANQTMSQLQKKILKHQDPNK